MFGRRQDLAATHMRASQAAQPPGGAADGGGRRSPADPAPSQRAVPSAVGESSDILMAPPCLIPIGTPTKGTGGGAIEMTELSPTARCRTAPRGRSAVRRRCTMSGGSAGGRPGDELATLRPTPCPPPALELCVRCYKSGTPRHVLTQCRGVLSGRAGWVPWGALAIRPVDAQIGRVHNRTWSSWLHP